jgi:uncharacterized protein
VTGFRTGGRRHRLSGRGAATVAAVLVAVACSGEPDETERGAPDATQGTEAVEQVALDHAGPAGYEVAPGVEQLLVSGAEAGEELDVIDGDGTPAAGGVADDTGYLLVRDLPPGDGYRVAAGGDDTLVASDPVEVWAVEDVPGDDFYAGQELEEGFQYVEARDGTLLAINVTLPGPAEEGPYPTVIEYSGYDPANPDGLQPSKLLAELFGYASVGVNMRGTGCSGGSFLFFEPAQWTDGYDAVEIVAAQPWVLDNEVGMVGLSYPGISQLFVARTQPPSLAAIAPLSVIEDTYRSTLYPGGILNDGFATTWADERQAAAEEAGQGWAAERIEEGDEVCAANQALRSQNPDLLDFIDAAPYVPEDRSGYVGRLAPSDWVDMIEVPVFLAGAWQDEQTGGRFPNMLDRFTGAPLVRAYLTNGGHTEPLGPEMLLRWVEFLDLYVAKRVPVVPGAFDAALAALGGAVFGGEVEADAESGLGSFDSYEEALAAYEAAPPVRVMFENGAGAAPGYPRAAFEAAFDAWPVPELEARTWYLSPGGVLSGDPPDGATEDTYLYDTSRSQQTSLASGGPWTMRPEWAWTGPEDGTALAYATEPLDETLVMAGTGRVDLHVGSTAPDVDLQVTLSEIRPDGTEVYVQNGWLRASHRALDEDRSTELRPEHTHLEADASQLPDGELVELNIQIFPFAHVFRAGSQIRLTVEGPGGTRPEWTFDAIAAEPGTINRLGLGGLTTSRVTLPVVPGLGERAPEEAPPCPSLRGQPCRPVVTLTNATG